VKGITLHLRGDLSELEADREQKERFISDTKVKLAEIHHVNPQDIVIMALTEGSITVTYALPADSPQVEALERQYEQWFGQSYLRCSVHRSFSQLQINPGTFAPRWNRDFTVQKNCPSGARRGCQPYNPPAGWQRFGMNLDGKFVDGDTWLGMKNGPGEWCIAYHGTKSHFVKSITESPLQSGSRNAGGRGIYCSPNPHYSEGYCDCVTINTRTGKIKCKYMFMCRVNTSSIHRCTCWPCPLAEDDRYTLHMTTHADIWFVNCKNQGYRNIRPYGLLVKEMS
jgi:hypothetical protein